MIISAILLASVVCVAPAPDAATLVRCGHLLAIPGQNPQDNVTLVIRAGKVEAIKQGFDFSEGGAREVDLRQSWVIPGLIDCHVHLTNLYDATVRQRFAVESSELVTLHAAQWAKRTLDAGFTTVRDLGSSYPNAIYALREGINQGFVSGPRIVAAGHAIAVTGGHGDSTLGYRPGLFPEQTPADGVADGPEECAKAVRAQIKAGADCIKLTATGGVLSTSAAGLAQHFSDAELASIVQTAHSMGRKVAAHAHGTDGINAAIRAGVDSIEHGTFLDDESIKLMKAHNCYHVPTLLAAQTVFENAQKPGFYLPMVAEKAKIVGPKAKEMFKRSMDGGVTIAFGTDTGVSDHGNNAREFVLMVEAGMKPTDTLVAATITASKLLGMENQVGSLEPGKWADFVVLAGDPRKDVSELQRITSVFKAGARER